MKESYANFRWRFLQTTIPTVILPAALPTLTARLANIKFTWYLLAALQLLSIILCNTVRIQWDQYRNLREAERLGGQIIPVVQGKWPGNIDIMFGFRKRAKLDYMFQWLCEKYVEYGTTTLNIRILWVDRIITIDEGVVKYVLATGFEHFDKGWRAKEALETFLGSGIFNRDDEMWKMHRAVARPFFARERIADFQTFERYTAKALSVIDGLGSGTPFDVQDLFARFTLDSAATFLFNTDLDTLSKPLPSPGATKMGAKGSTASGEFGAFANAFEECMRYIMVRRSRQSLWPLFEMFSNPSEKEMRVIKKWLDPMVYKALQDVKERKMKGERNDVEEVSFLEFLAGTTEDVELIRQQLLNILLAGRDTTSILLTCVIYMFTQHPEILARLRREVLETCPEGRIPTYQDIRNMKYLRALLNETLRVFPPVPGDGRATRSTKAALIPISSTSDFGNPRSTKPLYVPADTEVNYATWVLQRRKDLWGDDADVFDPDRWSDDRLERMVKNPLIFVPFNAGPRICLGQQFAYNEASFFLIRLLQEYDHFELAPDAQPQGSQPPNDWKTRYPDSRGSVEKLFFAGALTLYAKGGVWVRASKAKDT